MAGPSPGCLEQVVRNKDAAVIAPSQSLSTSTSSAGPLALHENLQRSSSVFLASIALLIIALDFLLKSPENRQEILWACYWASLAIITGIYFRWIPLVAWGVVFFAGLGLPAWMLGALFIERPAITSVLLHTIPFVAGLYAIIPLQRLPRGSALGAWMLFLVPFGLAWEFCRQSSAINLSHWAHWSLGGTLHNQWQFYGLLWLLTLLTLSLAAMALNGVLAYRGRDRSAR
jgi:hypothetical protein